ncbi:MAG TPA: hypothetical protein VNF68_10435, partial [Candidatus Baltobacteraceae bacterium]|nr:hypothetical protein [Candidatus Baltobacteraceae bacterium]
MAPKAKPRKKLDLTGTSLFGGILDSATPEAMLEAVIEHAKANPHTGGCASHQDEPEMLWNFSIGHAIDALFGKKRNQAGDIPKIVSDYQHAAAEAGSDAMHRADCLEQTDEELEETIQGLRKSIERRKQGKVDPEEDLGAEEDDEAELDDFEDDPEGNLEDDEDQESNERSSPRATGEDDRYWIELFERELVISLEEQERRRQPGYDHVQRLEQRFIDKLGGAYAAIRDVFVAYHMARDEEPQSHDTRVNGCVITDAYNLYESTFSEPYVYAAERLTESIAAARLAAKRGFPPGFEVSYTHEDAERMPPLNDGVGRRYRRCPCCGLNLEKRSSCFRCVDHYGNHPNTVWALDHNDMPEEVCAYAKHHGTLYKASRIGVLPSGRIAIAFPTFADITIRASIRKHYAKFKCQNLAFKIDDMTVTFSETLPPPKTIGDTVNDVLEINSVERIMLPATRPLHAWWRGALGNEYNPRPDSPHTIIEYATAVDVVRYIARKRTKPAILKRRCFEVDELFTAIVGDRLETEFGARIDRITVHARKPAT